MSSRKKDLVFLNTKNQDSMHLGMEDDFVKPFFNGIGTFKNILTAKMSRDMPC